MKEIPGYEGKYLVSENGEVYSVRRQGTDGRTLSKRFNSNGYVCVDLLRGKSKKRALVHRLVGEAFIPRPEGMNYINHIDGNKTNNHVSNLEWCTRSGNMKHAFSTGLSKVPCLSNEHHPNHKLTNNEVIMIRRLYNDGKTGPELSRQFGVSKEQIYNIISGKQRKLPAEELENYGRKDG